MATPDARATHEGIASTRNSISYLTSSAPAPISCVMTSKTMGSSSKTNINLEIAPTSQSYCRLPNGVGSPNFQDLINKGRQAQADDVRTVYETKKAKQQTDREKATRARLATDIAVRSLAMETRSNIDTCKEKLINDMEKNLRALLEAELRAEIREKVYEDEKNISSTYEREIKDSTRLQLENDLAPVVVAELSAKHEEGVKQTLRAELESEVKEELRTKYKAEFEEELKEELEDTVRKELQDTYRDEVSSELRDELLPSIRAEFMNRLGIQQASPAIDDLKTSEPTYSDLGNMHHLNYNGDFRRYGGETQYDEEETEDVFDDAREQFGHGLVNSHNLTDSIVDPNRFDTGLAKQGNIFHPTVGVEQPASRPTCTDSRELKRHIDEDYDEFDEEERSDVDHPANKKIKLCPSDGLTLDVGSLSGSKVNGDSLEEQARDDWAQSWQKDGDRLSTQLHENVNAYCGREQSQKNRTQGEDGDSTLIDGSVNAYLSEEHVHSNAEDKENGHSIPVNGDANIYLGEERPNDAKDTEGNVHYTDLNGISYGNSYGDCSGHYTVRRTQDSKGTFTDKQYATLDAEEGGNVKCNDLEMDHNPSDHEEDRESEEESSEEEDDEENTEEEDEEENNEEDDVSQNGLAYELTHERFSNAQINGTSHHLWRNRSPTSTEEDEEEEDYDEDGLAYERMRLPFGNHYRKNPIKQASRVFPHGVKHSRGEEDGNEVDEDIQQRSPKIYRGEPDFGGAEGYSEVDSIEGEYESDVQDAQAQRDPYGIINQTNTQEEPFVIDSSDDEQDTQAVDEERTLVEHGIFAASKVQTYVEESLFVA